MKNLLFVLVLISNVFAQGLLPLKLGNKWIYQDENSELMKVILDTTIIFNGFEYYSSSKDFSDRTQFYRLRDDGFYESTSFLHPTIWEYYKIDAQPGDIWYLPSDSTVPGFTPYYQVIDTVSAKIFGKQVTIKLLYLDAGIIARTQYWTEEFGMLLDSIVPFDDVVARLKGCVINGIAYGDTSLVSGIEEKKITLNTDYILNQNYPNPFNPTTNIKFSIVDAGRYMLKVYNILGQEVATLMNDQLNPGNHIVTFDASKLASGIYIYQLSGNNINLVKKMLLMK